MEQGSAGGGATPTPEAAEPDPAALNWAQRVRLTDGEQPFAYTPDTVLVETAADAERVRALLRRLPPSDDQRSEPRVDQAGIAGWDRWRAIGNPLSAVRRLKGAGIKAQVDHVFFADAGPGFVGANPVYGNPVYGNPVYGNPVYGNPVYGNPVYGNPVYGNPVYGNPVYGNPVYGNPVYGNPVYGNPVYGNPVYGNPAGGAPFFPVRCCGDTDRCECPATPPAAPMSFVYPNPAYVATAYPGGEGGDYQLTGRRRSQAKPLLGVDPSFAGSIRTWDTAECVRVAVLDTGHAAESDALLANPFSAVDGDPDLGMDGDGDGFLDPVAGHGTFIGGLIARIAPGCGLMVKRVLTNYGDGQESAIALAILDLVAQPPDQRPHILNLSFSGYTLEDANCLRNAIEAAMAEGIVVVASAGNDGVCRPAFPAAFDGVVSVAALGPDGPAPFSNWGSWVRACAPGVDVASTFYIGNCSEKEKYGVDPDTYTGWALWSGTSFAAPVVAAVLARTMMSEGVTGHGAVEAIIDQTGLFRIRCYGTVVNALAVRPF
jgi:hypothetical protein